MKPCPKCGSVELTMVVQGCFKHYVLCDSCGLKGPEGATDNIAESAWNFECQFFGSEPIPAPCGGKLPSPFVTLQQVRYDDTQLKRKWTGSDRVEMEYNPDGVYTKPLKIRRSDVNAIEPGSIRGHAGYGHDTEDEKTNSVIHLKGSGHGYLVLGSIDEVEEMLR